MIARRWEYWDGLEVVVNAKGREEMLMLVVQELGDYFNVQYASSID